MAVNGVLGTLTIVLSLALAAWALVATVRDKAPDRSHLIGLAVVQVAIIALAIATIASIVGGGRPDEPGTFWGYLATIVCLPPIAALLARMEPTRWGSIIVGVVCLTIPVLVVRLGQTWAVPGV